MCGNIRRYKLKNKNIFAKLNIAQLKEKMLENRHVLYTPTNALIWQRERAYQANTS